MIRGKKKYQVVEYPVTCPDCDILMRLKQSRFGLFYSCPNYPKCENTHGAHQATGKPLGKPANKETRTARIKAHLYFDRLWMHTRMSRASAYRWMAKALGISRPKCHIGRMNLEQCNRVIMLAQEKFRKLEKIGEQYDQD